MAHRVGILTAGGDCPGLNATIRGVARALYQKVPGIQIVGIVDGFRGLIEGESHEMSPSDFSGILTRGGTILGTARTPYKKMKVVENDVDKVASMKKNYKKMDLDCLFVLGGNGTHKTANLLSEEGLHVIGLPKTIDNDIWGTDVTFGFHTAVDLGTEVVDRIHTTACSHKRVMVIEIMGNKTGWLTLYTGIAGGADCILIPEIPFDPKKVIKALERRADCGHGFSIITVAEGAYDVSEAKLKKKERAEKRAAAGEVTITNRLAKQIAEANFDTRVVVPGHFLRGGSPSSYDRALASTFGVYAADLYSRGIFGVTVAQRNNKVIHNLLSEVAGKTKTVPPEDQMIFTARSLGISFGD